MPIGVAFFDTFLSNCQQWVDDLDLAPEMLISWTEMAEERFNNELRCREMVVTRSVFMGDQCVPLPDDFLEMILVRYTASGEPLRYISPDEYTRVRSAAEFYLSGPQTTAITYLDPATGVPLGPLPRQPAFIDYSGRSGPKLPMSSNSYTLIGQTLHLHPTVAPGAAGGTPPTEIEMSYYAKVLPIAQVYQPTPLFMRAPKLYTFATLSQSAPYLVEDQRAMIWDGNATALIKSMNESATVARTASSPILMQVRSFG